MKSKAYNKKSEVLQTEAPRFLYTFTVNSWY